MSAERCPQIPEKERRHPEFHIVRNVEISPPPVVHKHSSGSFWGSLVAFLFILLVLAAIAIPNFLNFCGRAKQSEAKQNLGAIFLAYETFHAANGAYPAAVSFPSLSDPPQNCFSAADWVPTGRLRYTYECMGAPIYWAGWDTGAEAKACEPALGTYAWKDGYKVGACGQVDNDPTLDEWTLNSNKEIKNVVDDLKN